MEIAKGKLNGVVQYCVYQIATGKWEPGQKLPSVRKGEELWNVNRLTVLGAYKALLRMGLITSEDRKGFFVSSDGLSKRSLTEKKALDDLYSRVKKMIESESIYNMSATMKYFSSMAAHEDAISPELGFVECSHFQALAHASEIENALGVHVTPIVLEGGKETIIPKHIKKLFTTGFHIMEVAEIAKRKSLEVLNVPIEIDIEFINSLPKHIKSATILELDVPMSSSIYSDLKRQTTLKLGKKVVTDIDHEIEKVLNSSVDEIILLSPRVWGRAMKKSRKNQRVKPIQFRIKKNAWSSIVSIVRIPFSMNI